VMRAAIEAANLVTGPPPSLTYYSRSTRWPTASSSLTTESP
jgi:hypothetical protein